MFTFFWGTCMKIKTPSYVRALEAAWDGIPVPKRRSTLPHRDYICLNTCHPLHAASLRADSETGTLLASTQNSQVVPGEKLRSKRERNENQTNSLKAPA